MKHRLKESAKDFLTNNVAVVCNDEPAFVSARQVSENRNWVWKMKVNDIVFALSNLLTQARAYRRGCKCEKRPDARYVHAADHLAQTLAAVVSDNHFNVDEFFQLLAKRLQVSFHPAKIRRIEFA